MTKKLTRSAGRYYGRTLNNPSPLFRAVKPENGALLIAEPYDGYSDTGEGDQFGYAITGVNDIGKVIWEKVPAREIKLSDSVLYVLPAEDEQGHRVVSPKVRRGIEQNHRTMTRMLAENGRFCDIESHGPSGLKAINHWFAPGEEPTHPDFIGQPVDTEAGHLIGLMFSGEATEKNKTRLAVLISDVALEESRKSPRDVHFDDMVSLVQERFFGRIDNGTASIEGFQRTVKNLTGDAIADVKTFVEYASRVGDGSTTKRVDTAHALCAQEGNTMDAAPSPVEVAKKTAEITRTLDKSRVPSVAKVEDVLTGISQDEEITEAFAVVYARLNRQYRFADAVRVSDDPKSTEAAQLQMVIAGIQDEVGRMGNQSKISFDRAYSISNMRGVVAVDHNDGLREGNDGAAADSPRDGTIHAHQGNPLREGTTDWAAYDRLFQAIGMLKKDIHKDLAWYLFGEDDSWTQQELADKYGKNQSSISRQLVTVKTKVEQTTAGMLDGSVSVEYGEEGSGDGLPATESGLQGVPDESDELRDAYRWWAREDSKTQRASLYTVDPSEAFSGTLRELFEATRRNRVSLREFCGWVQAHGKEAWHYSSAPQQFDQVRREYLDNGVKLPRGLQGRSEQTETDAAWKRFEGWFNRLPVLPDGHGGLPLRDVRVCSLVFEQRYGFTVRIPNSKAQRYVR